MSYRDMFTATMAVLFISGVLTDPATAIDVARIVLLIAAVVILGKWARSDWINR